MKKQPKTKTKTAPQSEMSPVAAIPQVRIRFPGDAPRMQYISGTASLYDIATALSRPVAKKLAAEIRAALLTPDAGTKP